jgi:hypothetical protein
MKHKNYLLLLIILVFAGCDHYDDYKLNTPSFGEYSLANETNNLSEQSKYAMEGIYKVVRGNAMFGDTLVLK